MKGKRGSDAFEFEMDVESLRKSGKEETKRKHSWFFKIFTVNLKGWKPVLTSRTFLFSAFVSLFITGLCSLSITGGFPLYRYIFSMAASIICLHIFSVFCLAQTSQFQDGFFLVVSFGYGWVGLLTLLNRAASIGLIRSDPTNTSPSQVDNIARYNELASLIVGILLARKMFQGWIPYVVTASCFFVANVFLVASVYGWKAYPDMTDPITMTPTTSFVNHQYAFIALFLLTLLLLFVQRRHFSTNVFVFLVIALFIRCVSTVFTAIYTRNTADYAAIVAHALRVLAFLFLFLSLTISTLKNPMETLFRNLSVKHVALQEEKVVVSWMIEQVPAIGLLIDQDGTIQHVNKFGVKSLGCKEEEITMKNFFESFAFENSSKEEASMTFRQYQTPFMFGMMDDVLSFRSTQSYLNTNPRFVTTTHNNHVIEWTFKAMNSTASIGVNAVANEENERGKVVFSRTRLFSDTDEKKNTTFLCLGRDITAEQERENLLKIAREKAENVSLMKDTFIANVSHELRTPLNCIIGVTDLLQQMNLVENQKEMTCMIKNSANSLLTLISDILDFSKLKQGQMKLNYAPLDLYSFVESAVTSMSLMFSNHLEFAFRIRKECPQTLITDETRLKQVLFNLYSNAIKFTMEGQVVLDIEVVNEFLQFQIIDSGIGMDEKDVSQLFERFFQADQGENKKPGTGIGLAISKQIVELMGGEITLTSAKGKGTTMRFLVPLNPPGSLYQPKKTAFSPTTARRKEIEAVRDQQHGPVFLCLKSPVVSAMIEESLKSDHGLFTVESFTEESLKERIQSLISYTSVVQEERKLLSIVLESEFLVDLNLEMVRNLQSKTFYWVQFVLVLPATQYTLSPSQQSLKEDFKVDSTRKMVQIPLLAQTIRKGQSKMYNEEKSIVSHSSDESLTVEIPIVNHEEPEIVLQVVEPLQILVVEDNKTNQKVMQLMLDRIGESEYRIVENGREAIEAFENYKRENRKLDCIFMDLQMPVMDGINSTIEIRRIEREMGYSPVHITALTANALPEEREKCLAIGMNDYLTKPIGLQTFTTKLDILKDMKNGEVP